jgi:hypothetical protein
MGRPFAPALIDAEAGLILTLAASVPRRLAEAPLVCEAALIMPKVIVAYGKKTLTLDLPEGATVKDLKEAFKKEKKYSVHRQSYK